jgi:hypothetical protein
MGDTTPEEKAFWDAADEYLIQDGERAGKRDIPRFLAYVAKLIMADKNDDGENKSAPIGESDLAKEVRELRQVVESLSKKIESGIVVKPTENATEQDEETKANPLAEKTQSWAGKDWE